MGQIKTNFSLILCTTRHLSHSLHEAVELKATNLKVYFKKNFHRPPKLPIRVWNENLLAHKRMDVAFRDVAKS